MPDRFDVPPVDASTVIKTARLARLLPFYRDVLGFEVAQHVHATFALLVQEGLALQLWQRNDCEGHGFSVVSLDHRNTDIRVLHARFARAAPCALMEHKPILQPWGSWEFGLVDCEGNQLVFEQWISGLRPAHSWSAGTT